MKVINYVVVILIFVVVVVWFFIKSLKIAGVYTDGYHIELNESKSEVIKRLEGTQYFVKNKEVLAKFCYDDNVTSSKKYLYFKYLIEGKDYLHVCFVATTWDDKTILVYYNIVDSECESKLINSELKNKELFINKFKENVVELAGNLN